MPRSSIPGCLLPVCRKLWIAQHELRQSLPGKSACLPTDRREVLPVPPAGPGPDEGFGAVAGACGDAGRRRGVVHVCADWPLIRSLRHMRAKPAFQMLVKLICTCVRVSCVHGKRALFLATHACDEASPG